MTSGPWDEEAVFQIARKIAVPQDRDRYLDQVCGNDAQRRKRIEALLKVDEGELSFLKSEPAPTVHDIPVNNGRVSEGPGAVIGPYKLLEKIGEGGMGVVFVADQLRPVTRRVALKIIRPGMDSEAVVARFEAERQALALMNHPNIAHVLDAGTTESGRPYFVMEWVRGSPITNYCDEHRLTVRQRLELFLVICRAVQHAHQKAVIHRDLKPSNILVAEYDDDAVPKIIDFGVAKALSHRLTEKTMFTTFGQIVGTLEYMSPEQARLDNLDVDTRSDIYSLGVVLYELLTGTTPFLQHRLRTLALDEAVSIIRNEEPPRPSLRLSTNATLSAIAEQRCIEPAKLRSLVRGELDWIVIKALDKDRSRRYETAVAFADDIRRYLADQRVTARPPTPSYLMRKFVRRNRGTVISGVLVLSALLLGLCGSLYGWGRSSMLQDELTKIAAALQVSNEELKKNNSQRDDAIDKLRCQLYMADMPLALAAYECGDFAGMIELLRQYEPGNSQDTDLRGMEWFYLWKLAHQQQAAVKYDLPAKPGQIIMAQTGKRLAVPLMNSTTAVFDLMDDGQWREVFVASTGHFAWSKPPFSFSPDGDSLAWLRNGRRELVIGKVATGQETVCSTASDMESLIAVPHADFFIANCEDGIELFSWSDGTPRKAVSPNFHFRDFAISHDGRTIACFDPTSHEVVIWDLIEGQEVSRLTDPALPLTSAAFSPSGDYFAAAGYDGNVYLYDATSPTFTLVKAIRVHEGSISGLAFSPSTNLLAFGTQDNSIRIWDLEGGFLKFILRGHSQAVIDMVFVGNDHTLMSTGDFTLRLWNLLETEPLQAWQRKMQVREMVFLGERRLGYYEVMQPEFRLLDMHSFVEESILFDTQIWAAAYHERVGLAIGSLHGQLQILDVESQARTAIETNFDAHVCALGISPLGDRFVAGSSDGIRGWEKIEGTWDNRFSSGKPALSLALFGDLIAWGDLRGEIGVCRWSDGRTLWSGPFHRADIHSLEFSPDGTCLLSSSLDGNIHLRDAVTGELLAEQIGTAEQWHAIFSPGGDSIITTGRDRYVTVRDRHTLQPRFRFPVLNATGKCLAFSPSGRRLAASTFAGQIQAWEVGSNRSP